MKRNFEWVIIICLLVIIVLLKVQFDGFILGYRFAFVLTDSMEPTICQGSLMIEKRITKEEPIMVGDIITFSTNTGNGSFRMTHRIVDIKEGRIYTKGDANHSKDNLFLSEEQIEAKVICSFSYFLPVITILSLVIWNIVFLRNYRKYT